MGNERKHAEGKAPFDEKRPEGADKSDAAASTLSAEAAGLLSEKQQLIRDSQNRTEYPALNAMAARATYYGLQGRLFPSMSQINAVMLESGPIGEAASRRMHALAAKGWTFGSLSPSDPFIADHAKSNLGKLAYSFVHGGYNDARSGKIAHNALTSMVNSVMGLSNGADHDAANKYIHELSHGKYAEGYNRYEATPEARAAFEKLSPELQKLHGAEMVREEVRALTAQIASNAHHNGQMRALLTPQTRGLSNYPYEAAVRQDKLGSVVKDVWLYEGNKALTAAEANAVAKDYIRKNYGELFSGSRVNFSAEKAIAAEISGLAVEAPLSAKTAAPVLEPALAPKYAFLSRGGQALGSLMLLSAAGDIHTQFRISTGSGVGRLLSVGGDWAGFEAGSAVGGYFGEALSRNLIKTNPRLAILALPLCALGSGIISSQIMHSTVSKPLELSLSKKLDQLLSK
ncbi:MAG: hypothetical protein K2X27_13295 [Candidatus Obscuribacterales bacterium]|nr:hypothetical protein [Candidatus Obscuribacterales bacterium]